MNKKLRYLWVTIILIIIDISIKIIIDNFCFEKVVMLNKWFGFKPYLNTTQLSIFNNELNLNVSLQALIILNIILIPIIPLTFKWLNIGNKYIKFVNTSEILLLSGAFCSLIDKIFWGGSLDFIYVRKLFICDLKDIYMFSSVCILIICFVLITFDGIENRKSKN